MEGWIKLHRKLISWEWYNDINISRLFIHLLLTANHKENKWQGNIIKEGEKITSREHLSQETGLTKMQVRLALSKLKSTSEITIKTTNRYSLIKINNWKSYQQDNQQHIKQITNKQPADNQQITTNKNDKNVKNDKNIVINNNKQSFGNNEINEALNYWEEMFSYKINTKVQLNRNVAYRLIGKYGLDKVKGFIKASSVIQGEQYAPTITNFIDLEQKLPNLAIYYKKQKGEPKIWKVS